MKNYHQQRTQGGFSRSPLGKDSTREPGGAAAEEKELTSAPAGPGQPGPASPKLFNSVRQVSQLAVGPHLAEALREQWGRYRKQLRKCQKDFSIENVHELRVQTRRLMAKLMLIRYVVPSSAVNKASRALKRRLANLGDLRDTHVQIDFLDENLKRFPGLNGFRDYLRRCKHRLEKPTFKKVERSKTRKIGRWIEAMRKELCAKADQATLQTVLAQVVLAATDRAFEEVVERYRAINPADLQTIHRTRVAFKRFRYMVECLPPDVLQPSARALVMLSKYQRKMGDIQDLRVLRARIDKFVRNRAGRKKALRPFRNFLEQRQSRLVRTYLSSADELPRFWPRSESPG
jgi:CHAD domain-containing protein